MLTLTKEQFQFYAGVRQFGTESYIPIPGLICPKHFRLVQIDLRSEEEIVILKCTKCEDEVEEEKKETNELQN